MPTLPLLPNLRQDQYDALVAMFNRRAQRLGLPGAVDAYQRFSIDNLIGELRREAYAQVDAEVETLKRDIDTRRAARLAEIDALIADLVGGTPPSGTPRPGV